MFRPKIYKKSGRFRSLRGVRLPRKKKFDTVIPTDGQVKVRSKYEKITVEWLNSHKIEFRYEPLLILAGKKYRPDFFLPGFDLFLEICGYGHHPFYRDRVSHKEMIYRKHNLNVVFVHFSGKGGKESLTDLLKVKLAEAGVGLID